MRRTRQSAVLRRACALQVGVVAEYVLDQQIAWVVGPGMKRQVAEKTF
ncbi:MAG: hypothetical protein M5R40_19435 [Anaerolineae bacterium]|nr:hypothetical protein [Anaerolineae bacterium]